MTKTERRIAYFKELGVQFLDKMPEGWRELKGATTAPNGYVWIYNGKSPLNFAEYKSALLKL